MCTKGRDVVNASWWLALTRNSSLKSNNCNALSPARQSLTRLPRPFGQGDELVGSVSVARVRPRTSKGITAYLVHEISIRIHRQIPVLYSKISKLTSHTIPPRCFGLPGLNIWDWFPSGLARTISTEVPTPFRALRRSDATQTRHRIGLQLREAFPVPGSVAHNKYVLSRISLPGRRRLLQQRSRCWTSRSCPLLQACELTCYCLKLPSAWADSPSKKPATSQS